MSTVIAPANPQFSPPPVQPQQYEPGGTGRRLVAHLVDSVVISIIRLPISFLITLSFGLEAVTKIDPKSPTYLATLGVSWLFTFISMFVYYGWFYRNKGATPGKMLLKLRVSRADDGTRIGYGRAFAREICKLFSIGLLFIGVIIMIFRKDKRSLHDLMCNTKVMHQKEAGA